MLKLCFPSAAASVSLIQLQRSSQRTMRSGYFHTDKAWRCTSGRLPAPSVLQRYDLDAAFSSSSDCSAHHSRRSISRLRYLICASMTAAPVISGAAPCGVVDSQLCAQIPSMTNTNGNLLSDRERRGIRLHFKTTMVIFSSFTIPCLYGLCGSA